MSTHAATASFLYGDIEIVNIRAQAGNGADPNTRVMKS